MPTAPVYLHCLYCQQKLRVPAEKLGQPGRCPRCKTTFPAIQPTAAESPAAAEAPLDRWTRRLVVCCWLWLGLSLLVAALLHLCGESWWINTLLLYSPRWLLLVPAVALAPFAACWSLRSVAILLGGTVAWLFVIAGLTLHWPGNADAFASGSLRVLTCNMQGQLAEPGRFIGLVARLQPDVVLLQEWRGDLNDQAFLEPGWNFAQSGNVWVASRLPIKPEAGLPGDAMSLSGSAGAFEVLTDSGSVRLVNVHLPTPREGISAALDSRLRDVSRLEANTLARTQASSVARQFCGLADPRLIVAGDFNMPVESSVYRSDWNDLGNAFSHGGCGFGWTKYTRWHGVRIDHILFGPDWTCLHCHVGPDIGSDHRPVFAVLQRARR